MPNPAVLVHRIIVHFESGDPAEYLADDITALQVVQRRLTVSPPSGPPGPPRQVSQVEFEYRAEDNVEYRTVVRTGDVGDPNAADHIRFTQPQPVTVTPQPPVVLPARDVRAGQTFGVAEHGPRERSEMSRSLTAGWHRSDCTWFYPY